MLAMDARGAAMASLTEGFPTAAAAVFDRNGKGELVLDRFFVPRRERA